MPYFKNYIAEKKGFSHSRREPGPDFLLSVILSFRNESAVIPELISRLKAAIEPIGVRYELLFINDDSTDNSIEILKQESKHNQNIRVIDMSRRFGVTSCIMAGLRFSMGDAAVLMDADLQDPPELIPEMLKQFKAQTADLVYTVRLSREGENPIKMAITRLAYQLIKRFGGVNIEVNAGAFKLMSRRMVNCILQLQEREPFMKGLLHWPGFKQVVVHYHREPRFAGNAKFPILGTLNPAREFLSGMTSFTGFPLKMTLMLGFLLAALGFVYFGVILGMYINGTNMPGWTTIVGFILIFGASHLITIGIVGLYVGRIYNDVKKRPLYFVKDTMGYEQIDSEIAQHKLGNDSLSV